MAYNTFGRYRYTLKDSTRRALDAKRIIVVDELDLAIDMQMDLNPGCSKSCKTNSQPPAITLAELEKI